MRGGGSEASALPASTARRLFPGGGEFREVGFCLFEALGGSAFVPSARFVEVLRHSVAALIVHAKFKLRHCQTLLGRLLN